MARIGRGYSLKLFLFSLVVLTISACAQRFDEIDERLENVQKRLSSVESRSGGSPAPVDENREALSGQKLADLRAQTASMRNEMSILRGKVEALEYDNKSIADRIDKVSTQWEKRFRELELELKTLKEQPPKESQGREAVSELDLEYREALQAHQNGDFEKAEKLFGEFISKHPKASLVDNALFWMGDGYMARKLFRKAITKFQDLIDRFPKSAKRCEAVERQIICLKELGQEKDAQVFKDAYAGECKN